jgi:hypothetical protein
MSLILATSQAVKVDIGLIATFGGIGLLVNAILVFIGVGALAERHANTEARAKAQRSAGSQ